MPHRLPSVLRAYTYDPTPGQLYVARWPDDDSPIYLRPVPFAWEDVDRLFRLARGDAEDGDASELANLAERLRRGLPKKPPAVAHLRALRIRLGGLLGLEKRGGARRPLPVADFAALLGVGVRQAQRYLAGEAVVKDREQLAVLRELWRRTLPDRNVGRDARWLRAQLARPIPLRTRRERRAHDGALAIYPKRGEGPAPRTRRVRRGKAGAPLLRPLYGRTRSLMGKEKPRVTTTHRAPGFGVRAKGEGNARRWRVKRFLAWRRAREAISAPAAPDV